MTDENQNDTTEPKADEQPEVNGVLISREFDENGNAQITGLQLFGDVRVTEVQTVLTMALAQFRERNGL